MGVDERTPDLRNIEIVPTSSPLFVLSLNTKYLYFLLLSAQPVRQSMSLAPACRIRPRFTKLFISTVVKELYLASDRKKSSREV